MRTIRDDFEQPISALSTAIAIWSNGGRIGMTLAARLLEEGYDVASLERFHMKK